jgi:hypothetical protein
MGCNGNCSLESCWGRCSNFFIENGVPGCFKNGAIGTFRASRQQSGTVMDTLTPKMKEVFQLMRRYIGDVKKSNEAKDRLEWAQLKEIEARLNRIANIVELRRAYRARRLALKIEHPYGYVEELGHHLSDDALEAMHTATQALQDFKDPGSFISYVNNQESILANPKKFAALRLAES